MLRVIIASLSILFCINLEGQIPLYFDNPSFEGIPKAGGKNSYVVSWNDCGKYEFPSESAFDLQPGFFEVDIPPLDGNAYIGMVTRANGSYESFCQKLEYPLIKDSLYQFSVYLAKSPSYLSPIRVLTPSDKLEKGLMEREFTHSTVLRIWGGGALCDKVELLFVTKEVNNEDWEEYLVEFIPFMHGIEFISFEVYYPDDTEFTRGNLMIDFLH